MLQIDHQNDLVLNGVPSPYFSKEIKQRAQIIAQLHTFFFTFNLFSVPMKCRHLDYFHVNKRYAQSFYLSEGTGLWKELNADLKTKCLKSSCSCLLPWVLCKQGLNVNVLKVRLHLVSSSIKGVSMVSKGRGGNMVIFLHMGEFCRWEPAMQTQLLIFNID